MRLPAGPWPLQWPFGPRRRRMTCLRGPLAAALEPCLGPGQSRGSPWWPRSVGQTERSSWYSGRPGRRRSCLPEPKSPVLAFQRATRRAKRQAQVLGTTHPDHISYSTRFSQASAALDGGARVANSSTHLGGHRLAAMFPAPSPLRLPSSPGHCDGHWWQRRTRHLHRPDLRGDLRVACRGSFALS